MNYEFKVLINFLHRKREDLNADIKSMLDPYLFMLKEFETVIFVVIPCPIKDCTGHAIVSSNRTIKDKIICDICHERIDTAKFRNRVIRKD